MQGDLTNFEVAKNAVKGMDFVLHQAAMSSVQMSIEDPLKGNSYNVNATLNLLIASRDEKIKRFVYASSSAIYGDSPELPKKEDFPVQPISPYALTKYAGERYCQIFWRIYKLPTICLRYFNVFGPSQDLNSQYSAVIPNFIKAFLSNKKPVVFGNGEQSRDFTFIDNVVEANLLSLKSEKGFGEVFNIGCGSQTSLNQLLGILNDVLKTNIKADYREFRSGDVLGSVAEISRAREILGYSPKITIEEGLIKTVDWYKNNGK